MTKMLVLAAVLLISLELVKSQHGCYAFNLNPDITYNASPRDKFRVDPGKLLGLISYSGFLTVKEGNHLFFWYFPKEDAGTTPWILWLNGGPGASSLLGLFDIMGPLQIENGEVSLRNTTWASSYSLLFIDSPVGAGFSYTEREDGYTTSSAEVGEQLYSFLEKFVEVFPELGNAPLFIAGESYAGKYLPSLGVEIHRNRRQPVVELKGISMGNALIHPQGMMHYSLLMRELGLMDDDQLLELMDLEQYTMRLVDAGAMMEAAQKYNETIEFIKRVTQVNIFNFEKEPAGLLSSLEEYVKRPDVREMIHVRNASFHLNNQLVYQKMLPDIMNTTKPLVEELLEHYGVMCYYGILDLFVPYSLSKRALFSDMQWSQREQYASSLRKPMRLNSDGRVVAYTKAGGNFMEVLIRGAGHMVPKENPYVAKYIIDTFIDQFK